MNNYTKHIGIVTNYIDNKYSITVDNKTIHMPFEIMHKLSVFPPSVMDGDHLKIGAQITLAKKDERIFYPDRDTYGTTRQETRSYTDGSYLLKDAKPFKQDISFQEMVSKFNTLMTTLPETTRMEALNTLMSMELTEEQKQEKLASMVDFPLDLEDTATLEKKGSLFDLAKKSKDDKPQIRETVESIAAMCNCSNQQTCQLVVGINSKTNKTCKLQDEIATFYPQIATLDQFQNTVLVPFIKSYTYDNPLLMSSLKYNWYSYNGDLLLVIEINYQGDPVICKGGRLPYRCDSTKMVAEGADLVNMIKKLSKIAA